MISRAKSKFIKSLQVKKYRKQEQSFVVEGRKSVMELFTSDFEIVTLVAMAEFLREHESKIPSGIEVLTASEKDMKGLGEFQTNDSCLAVVRMKPNVPLTIRKDEFVLVLEDIRDPGNLGTMIRTADWYGVSKIIASNDCADFYNSKVLHASMGSFTRVGVYYTDLVSYLKDFRFPVFGTFLKGENVHEADFGEGGLLVIGNEGRGISPEIEPYIKRRITIPKYGKAESLNAALATGIVLDNIMRGP